MSLIFWILIYLLGLLFDLWILRGNGAHFMMNILPTSSLYSTGRFLNLSEDRFKLWTFVFLIIHTFYFIIGLFSPEARFFWRWIY
jgi:hypothetical protein